MLKRFPRRNVPLGKRGAKITDETIAELDSLGKKKEEELMAI